MSKEPIWILPQIVHALHNRQLAEHGGGEGVRDLGLLDSALGAPKNKFHYEQADLPELAASYAFSLTKNHPFVDGNKRTAYVCMRLFLKLNGKDINASKEEKVRIMLDLAKGAIDQSGLTEWIKGKYVK
ncbi:MAG: type II toxin-antitoxin system death-on-curing family toxin [Proteobacteria bacterium]|nr:type II toxin-antitoxin system death-on-curing family toxin [Pseudomonadota bacterium]